MSLRDAIEATRLELDVRRADALGYCLAGCGYVDADTVEGESHGACPGPVVLVERDPNHVPERIEGGVERQAPPCFRCGGPTVLYFDGAGGVSLTRSDEDGEDSGEEWSFTLRAEDPERTEAQVCVRCVALALSKLDPPITLLEVRGCKVPWR